MDRHAQPTVLLITGAFTNTSCYDLLVPHLQTAGFPVVTAALASSDPEDPDKYTAATEGLWLLENYLLPLINEGNDVVVFAHSFGATSLSGAGQKLSKQQRSENGLSGGVVGLIYISFAMCINGQSQLEYLGGVWPDFCKLHHPRKGVLVFDPAIDKLFNDAEPELQQQLAKDHLPHSINVFETPVSSPLWTDPAFNHRRVLIKTMLDTVFPPPTQQMFADNSGVDWKIVDVEAGHEAFLTKPLEVAEIVLESVEQFSRI